MAFCAQCGKQVSDEAAFCPSCGATLSRASGEASGPAPPPSGTAPGMHPTPPQPPVTAPQPYMPGAAPPPPGKKRMGSGWKIALVVILIAILVIGAVIAALAIFVFKTVKAPVDVTNRYIEAVNDGDAREAWSLLHPDSRLREDYNQSSFENEVVRPNINALRTWNAHEVNVKDSRATVTVDMKFTTGEEYEFTFELRKDGGDWLIYEYNY